MFRPINHRLLIAALCGIVLAPPQAFAGWICIKNESKLTVIVREVPDRPRLRRAKVVKLQPGEVYREHQPRSGERKVQIFDAHDHSQPLSTAKLTWKAADDVTYRVEVVEQVVQLSEVVPKKPGPVIQVGTSKPDKSPKR